MIVDAAFLRRSQRDLFRALAADLGLAFYVLDFVEDKSTLHERIVARLAKGNDASEADLAVLEYQQATEEPLTAAEMVDVIRCNGALLETLGRSPDRWNPLLESNPRL